VHGLLALLEIQASRLPARTGPDGAPVLLPDQDRRRWDRLLVRRGLAALDRVRTLGGDFGPYALQAAIAAAHAEAVTADETDWRGSPRSTGCWSRCRRRRWPSSTGPSRSAGRTGRPPAWPSPTRCAGEKALARYPHLPAVRADLLEQLGRTAEAAAEFARAAELTANERERALFLARAEAGDRPTVD
jgi:predicted RNA polymerase sigma factor